MAAGNNIQISLNLDDTQFKNGIKRVGEQLQSLTGVKKLKVDVEADVAPFQQAVKDALASAKKAGALSYTAKNGKTTDVSNTKSAISAYKRYIELADKASTTKEQNSYLAKANAVGQYLQSLSALGNKMKEIASEEERKNKARISGNVKATKNIAYKEAMSAHEEQVAADRRFRNKEMEGLRQKDKAEKAEQKAEEQQEKERNKRYSKNVREYDKQIKSGTDTTTPELFDLKKQYLNGESNWVDKKKSVKFDGLNAQIENLQTRLVELQKIFNQLGTPKTKGDKRYFAQIEGEINRVKAELEPLLEIQKKLNTNATPTSEQSKWSKKEEEKQRKEAQKVQSKGSVFNDKNAYVLEGYEKRILKLRKQIGELNKIAVNPGVSAKTLQELEKLKQELNSIKEKKAALQEDPKVTQRAYRDAYQANRRKYAEQDKQMNRMTNGGNSNQQLAQMRAFYREQERAAEQQAKALAKQEEATRRANAQLEKQGGLLGRLKHLAASYLSIFTAFRYIKSLVDTTGYFEQQQVALEGILGSAAAATKAIGQLKSMALQSPKQFKELVNDAKQLSAYGIEVEKLLPTVKQLADISVGLGVDMGRLTLAYGQVKSATVLRGQELRQFTEAGVPMVEELAKRFTQLNGKLVSTSEIFELISKRQVSFEMVADVLRDMTAEGGKFYNMQENISETLYGQKQKLQDLWTINLNDTGSSISGVLMAGVKALQLLIKESRTLLWIFGAAGIMVGVRALVNGYGAILTKLAAIKASMTSVHTSTKQWWAQVKAANGLMGKSQVAAQGMKAAFKGLGTALMSNAGIMAISALVGVITRAVNKARELGNELEKIDKSFAKDNARYVQGFDSLIGKLSTLTEGTKKYNETLDTLKNNYSDYVNPAIINQLIAERKQLDDTTEGWGRLHDSIVAAINAKSDYERHLAKKEKAGDSAIQELRDNGILVPSKFEAALKKITDLSESNALSYGVGGKEKYDKKLNKKYYGIYREMSSKEGAKNINSALIFAIESFISQGLVDEEDLQSEIKRSFKNYGVKDSVAKFVLENIDTIWKALTSTEGWKNYLIEHNAAENSDYAKIDQAFNDAQRRTSQRQEGRWHEGMSNADYNPTKLMQAGQYDVTIAARNLIADLSKEIAESRKNGTNAEDIYITDENGSAEKGQEMYNKAVQELNKEFKGISVAAFQDADKVNRIAQALTNLKSSISDGDLVRRIEAITGKFTDMAGVKSGQAAQVSTNITRDFLDSNMYLSHEEKDWYAKYVRNTTNETYDSVREGIRTLYQENKKYIDSYSNSPIGANKEEVERRKAENARLEKLAGREYYDIDLTSKKSGGAYNHNKEYDEFLNEFKSAYDMYKKAVQQGGVSMGAAFVQNNKQVQDMFGGFFNGGEFGDKFKQVKVGDKSVIDLIQDKFISDGIEKGIVDFRGAAEAVAAELKVQADKNKGTAKGQDYLQEYNTLMKWIQSAFSKDTIDGFLKDLEKSLNDLSLTFDKTNKNVELYRKMIQQGTQDKLGGIIGEQYKAQATTPQSTIMKGNIQKVVEVYNTKLDEEAKSNPDSAIAKSKNEEGLYEGFSLGSLNTIDDIYKALQQIDKLEQVNQENFTSSEAGKITIEKLRPMLQQLLSQLVAEISSIDGHQYTGDSLDDSITNAKIDMNAAHEKNVAAQRISIANGSGIDYGAIQELLGQSEKSSTDIFDNFLAQNDFEDLYKAAGKWKLINFDDMKDKLDKATENLDPLTKLKIQDKFTDLKKKVEDFNSSTGANFFRSIGDYHTADERAKQQFDTTVAKGKAVNGATYDAEKNKFTYDETGIPPEKAAQDAALIADINRQLENMGVNGEKASNSFKTDALQNMDKSITETAKHFSAMVEAVNGVVSAMKSFVSEINHVYDVMNDGENPAWMQDVEDGLDEFGNAFNAIVAPIIAVIALLGAMAAAAIALDIAFTPLLIIMIAIIAVAAAIAAIVMAFKAHDNALERSIDNMKEEVDALDNAITNLNAAAERSTGLDKLVKRTDAVGKSATKASEYANMAAAEDAKKNTDEDKVKEYRQQQQEAEDEFKNSLLDMLDELVSSTEDWASAMGDAIRSAFQNGENAARSFRSTVKTMIGDVVENMLEMAILQPLIESAIQEWTNQDYLRQKYTKKSKDKDGNTIDVFDAEGYQKELLANINNSEKAEDFYDKMLNIGNTLIDTENNLPDFLQDALWYNSDTQSLSGGIESITEDTARRLEALSNSQLGALLNIQSILQNYIGGSGMYSSSPMANIQSTIALIQGDTAGIRSSTQALLNEIRAVRATNSQPIHVVMV